MPQNLMLDQKRRTVYRYLCHAVAWCVTPRAISLVCRGDCMSEAGENQSTSTEHGLKALILPGSLYFGLGRLCSLLECRLSCGDLACYIQLIRL